uniref:Uncharacterized protein n=1 Tax=Anguilla anguilla TaxID=7936 RepID=A0A0E9TVN8_ANGAN
MSVCQSVCLPTCLSLSVMHWCLFICIAVGFIRLTILF